VQVVGCCYFYRNAEISSLDAIRKVSMIKVNSPENFKFISTSYVFLEDVIAHNLNVLLNCTSAYYNFLSRQQFFIVNILLPKCFHGVSIIVHLISAVNLFL